MLTITIHHNHKISSGVENPLLDGTGQTTPANATNQANLGMNLGEFANSFGGPVSGIIINEDDLKTIEISQRQ
jgi:hypothetical protein